MKHKNLIYGLLLFISMSGCTFQVPVLRMRPAAFEVTGVSNIGVLGVSEGDQSEEILHDFTKKVQETLKWRGFFKEVRLLEGKQPKTIGLDAVLKIDAEQLSVQTDSGIETIEKEEETGKKIQEVYQEGDQQKVREVPEKIKRIYEIPYVQKEIFISLLVDFEPLKRGIKSQQISFHDNEKIKAQGEEGISALPSNKELLQTVSNPFVSQVVDSLVPHLVAEKIKLANDPACQPGMESVKQGNWEGALASWQGAVQANPQNHSAHYNLGVAYEALKKYPEAKISYQRALEYSSRGMYRKALDRLQSIMEENTHLQKQMGGHSSSSEIAFIKPKLKPTPGRPSTLVENLGWDIQVKQAWYEASLHSLEDNHIRIDPPQYQDLIKRLRKVLNRLKPHTLLKEIPYEVHFVDDPTVNASCLPGGGIFFFRGIFDPEKGLIDPRDEDEIAAVMGHEMAHASLRHGYRRFKSAKSLVMVGNIISAGLGGTFGTDWGDLFEVLYYPALGLSMMKYSRTDESQADLEGLYTMMQAGYHPEKMIQIWKRAAKKKGDRDKFSIFSSHPTSGKRAKDLAAHLEHIRNKK